MPVKRSTLRSHASFALFLGLPIAIVFGAATSVLVAAVLGLRAGGAGISILAKPEAVEFKPAFDLGFQSATVFVHRGFGLHVTRSIRLEYDGSRTAEPVYTNRGRRLSKYETACVAPIMELHTRGETPLRQRTHNGQPIAGKSLTGDTKVFGCGWPQLCLWTEYGDMTDGNTGLVEWVVHAGWIPRGQFQAPVTSPWTLGSTNSNMPGILPYHVYWPGLLANTAFFGAIWLIPLALVPAVRRVHRRRRGRCVVCAYDLSATPIEAPCPECGGVRAA